MDLGEVLSVYQGSDGERTRALYRELESRGAIGTVAMNLFRACKASQRAKLYRGGQRGRGSYRSMAYAKKAWSIDELAAALTGQGAAQGIAWGWGVDEAQPFHRDVLYVDLPSGQVSFHTAPRGKGPDYGGAWDGVRGMGPQRICRFCADVLGNG